MLNVGFADPKLYLLGLPVKDSYSQPGYCINKEDDRLIDTLHICFYNLFASEMSELRRIAKKSGWSLFRRGKKSDIQ
jgi:hypothetical protein